MESSLNFNALAIDCERVAYSIESAIRHLVREQFRRRGAVIGISGGIDSSVVAALCARALGADRVLGLFTPECDSDDETLRLSRLLADSLGIESELEEITGMLRAAGCYRRRDEAIRQAIPDFDSTWRAKIVMPGILQSNRLPVFSVVALSPDGKEVKRRLSMSSYLGVVAATNFKQRMRKMVEYYHAECRNFVVVGTPNRLEYDQGFFVKGGDGLADIKPIAHLYKSQVYALAEFLDVPEEIRGRPPTTDTYSLPQGQDEFYFSLPYRQLDLCLYGKNHGYPPESLCDALELDTMQIERVYRDIDNKRRATRHLHLPPQLVDEVDEVSTVTAQGSY